MKKKLRYKCGRKLRRIPIVFLFTMKLSVVLITMIACMQATATAVSQKISLSVKQAPMEQVIKMIKKRSGHQFIYNHELLQRTTPITLQITDGTLEQILEECFKHQPLTYQWVEETIVIKSKPITIYSPTYTLEKSVQEIKGKVSDDKGSGLPGVNIMLKGTTQGVTTDNNGLFTLEVPDLQTTLVFSFVGYQTQEIAVGQKTWLDVLLQVDEKILEEVVVVGFGIQKKVNLTGSVDVISNKQLQSRPSPTVSQLLQGQSPGMNFSVNNHGFRPGAEMDINIRGIGSLNGGGPFVLVDGIPGDMNRVNPEDIESISVLKDAAASAIYGARAPYGVILITTKSGRKDDKMSISYSGTLTQATPQRLPTMPDSYTYARIMNEAGTNGGGRVHTNDVVDRIIAFQNQDWEYLKKFTVPDATHFETVPLANGTWGFNQNSHANYDWFKENYGKSLNHQHNLSIQGGSKSTSYYFSAGYYDQGGVLKYGTDTYDRMNLMGKIKTNITPWWDLTYQPRLMKSTRIAPNPQAGEDYSIIFHQIARTRPNSAKYDGYGNIMVSSSKIPWLNDSGTNNDELTENIHRLSSSMKPLAGWNINLDIAYRNVDAFGSYRKLTVYDYLVNKSPVADAQTVPSWIEQAHQSANYWTTNLYSSYAFQLASKHNMEILAGYQAESSLERSLSVRKNTLLVPNVLSLQTAIGTPIANEDLSHWSTQGYFSRFTYNFKEKYLIELNVRHDGTSRFRKDKRWGTFPSVSAGWNIDKENFWTSVEHIVNGFKLRGSWGKLGNQNVAPYQDLNLIPLVTNPLNWIYTYGQSRPIGYTGTPSLVSPYLSWESSTTKNLGVDLTFLNEKLRTTFDWFERTTTDMIGPAEAQPGVLGASLPKANNSSLRTRGWELALNWQQQIKSSFSYFLNANLYDARTFITQYHNPTGLLTSWYKGKEQGEIWGYTAHDLYRTQQEIEDHRSSVNLSAIWGGTWRPGDVKYEDLNNDGRVNRGANTLTDHGDLSIIGNNTPRFQYGLSGGVQYKGFDLSFLFKGTAKRDLFFSADENVFWGFRSSATQASPFINHLDYFRDQEGNKYTGLYEGTQNINLNAYFPRPYLNGEDAKNKETSTRYLQNGAYLRLQNVQLGYQLPASVLQKLRLQKARLYVSGENLFTLTALSPGIDPIAVISAWGVGKTYGADRMLSLGISLTY